MFVVDVFGGNLYVSPDGHDLLHCSQQVPCRTFHYTVSVAEQGDVIHMAKGSYDIDMVDLDKNMTVTSWNDRPTLTCQSTTSCNLIIRHNTCTLEDVNLDNCKVCATDSSIVIQASTLVTSVLQIETQEANIIMQANLISCRLQDTQVTVVGSQQESASKGKVLLNMQSVIMTGNNSRFRTYMNSSHKISMLAINLLDVTFKEMLSQITIQDFTSLELTADRLHVHDMIAKGHCFSVDIADISAATIYINNSRFSHNYCGMGGALHFFASVVLGSVLVIENSIFEENIAVLAGSGIKLDMTIFSLNRTVHIKRCTFLHNYNMESGAGLYINGGVVRVTDSSFLHNVVETGSIIIPGADSTEHKGSGGAIYIKTTAETVLDNCVFINNSASLFGGALGSAGSVNITNTYFEAAHSDTAQYAPIADVFYMSGYTGLGNVTFNVTKAFQNVPLVWYSSQMFELFDLGGNISMHCPPGSQFTNATLAVKNGTNVKFKSLFYTCNPCPDGKYSLQHGYRIGSLAEHNPLWSENFVCQHCSYGGFCQQGSIQARINFWGYTEKGLYPPKVHLLPCPDNYCCDKEVCDTYNTCSAGRTGTLCGQCADGMAELLFLKTCVPNSECHDSWYLAIDMVTAMSTVAFFLYQIEFGMFIINHVLGFKVNICSRRDSTSVQAYFKSIFYFYQTVALLTVQKNQASEQIGIALQPLFSVILSFQPITAFFGVCPFPDLNPVVKTILSTTPTLFVFAYILILALTMYIYNNKCSNGNSSSSLDNMDDNRSNSLSVKCEDEDQAEVSQYIRPNLKSRLACTCLQLFLLNYMTISNMTFALLACVNINGDSVLYIDGTIPCVSAWQSIFIILAVVHVIPLFLAVIVSRKLLEDGHIGLVQFYAFYFVPLIMLIYWGVRWLWLSGHMYTSDANETNSLIKPLDLRYENARIKKQILLLIEEPYRKRGPHAEEESVLYWEGILIFRRLVLSIMKAFTFTPLLQITLQSLTCLIFLLWHVVSKPFNSHKANKLETASLTTLTMVAVVHVVQATFFAAGKVPEGPANTQIYVTDWIEYILVNLLPMLIALAVIITLIYRVFVLAFNATRVLFRCTIKCCTGPTSDSSQSELNIPSEDYTQI